LPQSGCVELSTKEKELKQGSIVMGKVHEALKKAELEGNEQSWSSRQIERRPSGKGEPRIGGRRFDFIDYSLNASGPSEIDQHHQDFVAGEPPRKSLVEPSREISVDMNRIAPQLISFHDPNSSAAEEYNKLAVTLMTRAAEGPLKRVMIASAQHGEGRTSILLNLACALSRAHQRVLVLDTDLHRPSLLRLLGLSADIGLPDAINKGLPAGSAVTRVKPFGLDVLPTRERVKNPAELLNSYSFSAMLELLEPDYDFVLFDSSPLLTVADSSLLVRQTQAVVLVIRAGKTSSGQIGRAIGPLVQNKILGVVLNRTEKTS